MSVSGDIARSTRNTNQDRPFCPPAGAEPNAPTAWRASSRSASSSPSSSACWSRSRSAFLSAASSSGLSSRGSSPGSPSPRPGWPSPSRATPSPRRGGKYRSNSVSKALRYTGRLHIVVANAARTASRSSQPTAPTARAASTVSAVLTGTPARRSAAVKSTVRSTRFIEPLPSPHRPQGSVGAELELADRAGLVAGVLEHDPEGAVHLLLVERVEAEREHGLAPVDGLRDRRCLLQLHRAQRPDGADQRLGQLLGQLRDPGEQDLLLPGRRRVVEVQVEAAALEGLGQLTGRVRGEDDERPACRRDRAELGDRHLE